MAFGLTEFGFEIPTYEEWLQLYRDTFKDTFGLQDPIAESSLANDFLSIFALQDIRLWQSLEAIYNSQTLNGADGIYLDEILGRRGVFRSPAAPGSGIAIVKTLRTAPWATVIPTTASFSGSNSINYTPDADTQIKDIVYALRIPLVDFGASISETFSGKNSSTTDDVQITLNPQSGTFLNDLEAWLKSDVFVEDNSLVFQDSDVLYVGFNSSDLDEPIGVTSGTEFFATINVGDKWSGIPVTATVTGANPLAVGNLTSITPTSFTSGATIVSIDDVTNFVAFQDGSATETDAEYRVRFNNVIDEAIASTRPAIQAALLKLDGVAKIRIYDNPTDDDTPEAPAFTFQTIVVGGSTADIPQTLYDTKPINTVAHGTIDTTIQTEDGGSEVVGYTPANLEDINVKIIYKTSNSIPLSVTEINQINTNLSALATNFLIGDTVFTAQLQSAVFAATGYARFSSLSIEVKKVTEPDTSYTTSDYVAAFDELPTIESSNVIFEQSL